MSSESPVAPPESSVAAAFGWRRAAQAAPPGSAAAAGLGGPVAEADSRASSGGRTELVAAASETPVPPPEDGRGPEPSASSPGAAPLSGSTGGALVEAAAAAAQPLRHADVNLGLGQPVQVRVNDLDDCVGEIVAYDPELDWYTVQISPQHSDGPAVRQQFRREEVSPLKGFGGPGTGSGNNRQDRSPQIADVEDRSLEGLGRLVDHDVDGTPPPSEAAESIGSKLYSILKMYCRVITRCPCCVMLLYIILVAVLIGAAWRPPTLDTDFSDFIQADGSAQRQRQAYLLARTNQKDLNDEGRRLYGDPTWKRGKVIDGEVVWMQGRRRKLGSRAAPRNASPVEEWQAEGKRRDRRRRLDLGNLFFKRELTVLYLAKSGNALEKRALAEVRDFERRLRSLDRWGDFCQGQSFSPASWAKCDPGESLIAYAWPSQLNATAATHRFELRFDARGEEMLPIPAVLAFIQNGFSNGASALNPAIFFPRTFDLAAAAKATAVGVGEGVNFPAAMRTTYTFTIRVGASGDSLSKVRASLAAKKRDYEAMISDVVYPFLSSASRSSTAYKHILIYYSGDVIDEHEVTSALYRDLLFAMGSFAFCTLYLWIHTRSVVLSICSLFLIIMSVPVAYVLTPMSTITVASFLSLFLIMALGSDIIFMFVDFWEQGAALPELEDRLAFMILHAGRGCLATSFTMAKSFLANLSSALKPLREFGLFMGMCTISAFLLVLFFMPPVLFVRERWQRRVRHRIVDISCKDESFAITEQRPQPGHLGTGSSGSRGGIQSRALARLIHCIARCPCTVVVLTVVTMVTFFVGTATRATLDTSLPVIFPPWHNQVAGKALASTFGTVTVDDSTRPTGGSACAADDISAEGESGSCIFHWCQTPMVLPDTETSGGCWRGPTLASNTLQAMGWTTSLCSKVVVRTRIAAREATNIEDSQAEVRSVIANMSAVSQGVLPSAFGHAGGLDVGAVSFFGGLAELKTLVLEDWETGQVTASRFFDAPSAIWLPPVSAQRNLTCTGGASTCGNAAQRAECEVHVLCFSDAHICNASDWKYLGEDALPSSSRAAASPRLLQVVATVPASDQIDVAILFGILAPRRTPLVGVVKNPWSFDPAFEPGNPWAQRAILSMCTNLPPELQVVTTRCWIQRMRTFLQATLGKPFPSRDFDEDVVSWYNSDRTIAGDQTWFVRRKMLACKVEFYVDRSKQMPAHKVLAYMAKWDDFVNSQNNAASVTSNQAWHTAAVWVSAEAEVEIVSSTEATIVLSIALGGLGMLIFTMDLWLSILVLLVVTGITGGLTFFMVVVMSWSIGPIEVIALVIFIGYAVNYALHVAHHYALVTMEDVRHEEAEARSSANAAEGGDAGKPAKALTPRELRLARTRIAVLHVGKAMFSSAVSTIGSSVFLLFCTLTIFSKLGAIVIAVTLLSITFALVTMPALLILVGSPLRPWHMQMADWVAKKAGCFPKPARDRELLTDDADDPPGVGELLS